MLAISDLGRTHVSVGEREFELGQIRRKAAALLMFLVTRPGHTATREQALDELWPDSDPSSASNNLNQSLHFLRREIDPWFEDDISVDYIGFQGDVVWLDPDLSSVASVVFATEARRLISERNVSTDLELLASYTGQFSPEFEYEEWAMSWRARVHALFLELANTSIAERTRSGDLRSARDVALIALSQDPMATEIERKLIWLYWHLGSHSAAVTHHEHLALIENGEGLDPVPLTSITNLELGSL
jgi:DNA-binding SARP family transcriptional activator